MKTENEINEEIRQLLDSLEEHGKNARRQKELGDLIDRLAEEEKVVELPHKRRKLTPLWWAMGAAAACLLLWLFVKPTAKQNPKMNEEILVEETETFDSIKTEVNDVVFEESIINEEPLAEEAPIIPQKPQMKKERSETEIIQKAVEQSVLAEVTPTEPADTMNMESNTIPTVNETPLAVQSPKRRVIRSLNLVCYECQKEPENTQPSTFNPQPSTTLFGQPQDPNMKNGALAFEIKLN